MSSSAERGCRIIHDQFVDFYAAWPPNAPLKLGDFGYLNGAVFQRKSHLSTYGIEWKTRRGTGESTYSLTSGFGTNVTLLGKGDVAPGGITLAKALAEVSFSSAGSVFFNAAGCTVDEIENEIELGRSILNLFAQRQWNDDWWVVTRLIHAKSTTVAVSESAEAGLSLEAASDQPYVDLANAELKLVAKRRKDVSNVIVSETGLTPLVALSRVRKKLLGSPVFKMAGGEPEDTMESRERLLRDKKAIEQEFEFARG